MADQAFCPVCGARLEQPGQPCPFCTEARRLVLQLASEESVRLCARCGNVLEEDEEGQLCSHCQLEIKRQSATWRREDRIARWLTERLEPPSAVADQVPCPHCAGPIFAGALFCPHCGQEIDREEEEAGAVEIPLEGPRQGEVPVGEGKVRKEAPPPGGAFQGKSSPREGASLLDTLVAFFREAFQPAGALEGPVERPSIWEQMRGLLRSLLPSRASISINRTLLWTLLFLLMAIAGMTYFWLWLLSSGGVVLR